jgi:hypothetical protein
VNWKQLPDGLDFDHETAFDQKIDDVSPCELHPFAFERQDHLAVVSNRSKIQLTAQASVIAGLQKARAEVPMDVDRCADDSFADWIGTMPDQPHSALPKRRK